MRENQTMTGLGLVLASVLSFGATACDFIAGGKELNLEYCQAHPGDSVCADYCLTHTGEGCPDGRPAIDAPTTCASNAECSGAATVCDVAGSQTCVLCTATDHAACTGVAPVCGANKASCRACAADAECESGVCRDDGSCEAAASVIYASPAGSGSGCTLAAPCGITTAIGKVTATLNVMHLAPGAYAYTTPSTLDFSKDVTVIGRGATIDRNQGNSAPSVTVSGSANVAFEFVTITGGDGVLGHGVSCTGTGAVTLRKVTATANAGVGVSGGACTVTVSRSTVSGNTGGGIAITGGVFKLTNNFIVSNGSGTSAIGGIQLSNITQAGAYECAFNTIYNNDAIPSAITGISCQTVGVPLSFKNNIVYGNKVSTGGTQVGGSPMCQHTYSDIGPDATSGTGNINADPLFVNVAQQNTHLQASSPAKDVADPAATLAIDIDGDTRPQGAGRDIGADEFKP